LLKINEAHKQFNVLYLATDDYNSLMKFKQLLSDNFEIIHYTTPIKLNGERNIHYGNPNKDEVILNTLIDMYHLTYSTDFIPSEYSSFSKRVYFLRQYDNFF
jgi:hypothetical protein